MAYRYFTQLVLALLVLASNAFAQDDTSPETIDRVAERWDRFEPKFTEYICPFHSGLTYDPAEFVCGYVLVPEDRTDADSRLIKLSILQIKSTNAAPKGGAVIRLTGGPGGASLSAGRIRAYQDPDNLFMREIADLIFFDQRGIGYSEGHFCRAVPDAYQYGVPITPDGENAYRAAMRQCLEEARAQHIAVDAYSTWHNALDVRDIRIALGYDKWTLFGVSYGTALGQAIIEVDEDGVRAAILDSVVPANGDWEPTGNGFRSSLRAVSAACAEHSACARDVGDLEARMEAVIRSYDETPMRLEGLDIGLFRSGQIFLNGEAAANFVFQMLYRANLYRDLPILLDVLENRDGETIKTYAAQASWPLNHMVGQGMRLVTNCRSATIVSDEQQAEGERVDPDFTRWMDLIDQTDDCRKIYGIRPDPSVKVLETDLPILIAAGAADPITPPHYSQSIMTTLPNAQYVEFPYTGHGALMTHFYGCGGQILAGFISDPGGPLDTACTKAIQAPDFLTRVHKTKGPYRVAMALQSGQWPYLPILATLGLLITVVGFPMGMVARIVDRAETRHVGRARTAAWLGAALSITGLVIIIWFTRQTITQHPMALPIGVLPGAVIGGWFSLVGAASAILGIVQMLRFRQHGQPGIGTITGITLTALLATVLCAYLMALGLGPF